MSEQEASKRISSKDPVVIGLRLAVHAGDVEAIQALLRADPALALTSGRDSPGPGDGQRSAAEYLLSRGADLNWEPDYAHGTPLDAASGHSTRQENVITWLRELGARSASSE